MRHVKQTVLGLGLLLVLAATPLASHAQTQQSGSVGVEGKIGADPPKNAATISLPRDGQVFTDIPIVVNGICSGDVLIKIFKNNVFGGSVLCQNGSYAISIDLFSGRNELVARVYDALDQAGPDSNVITVTYNDSRSVNVNNPTLTSNYAKRGANPKETLTWPIILSGGEGPYAVSVDWGDGTPSDLFTRNFAGTFDISHAYNRSGVYNIIIRASDKNDSVAFLQVVGIANGPLSQDETTTDGGDARTIIRIIWWPLLISLPLLLAAFWLGRRHAVQELRRRLENQ